MNKESSLLKVPEIQNLIYNFRGLQIMLDRDLASFFQVETRTLNQAVKRNNERFPEALCFQLNKDEFDIWKSQIVMSDEDKKGLRRPPYVFTEQGVAMLSAVLNSKVAIHASIQIMCAFVEMRKIISAHGGILLRMDHFEQKQIEHDLKFEKVFKALESGNEHIKQGVFFNGQTFDSYKFVADLIRSANKSIQLVDNYIDESVLLLLTKRKKGVYATIYTKQNNELLKLDLKKHNSQYEAIEIKLFDKAHDRFLIIDSKTVYHIGASLKDLGKKWFAFSLIDKEAINIIEKLNEL